MFSFDPTYLFMHGSCFSADDQSHQFNVKSSFKEVEPGAGAQPDDRL